MDDYHLAKENVKRYTSFIKNPKRTDKQKETDQQHLAKWTEICQIFVHVLGL